MDFSVILDILQRQETFFVLITLIVVLLVFFVVRTILKKRLSKTFSECEVRYNAIRSVPILFKLNKANGLAKVNKDVSERVEKAKKTYETLQEDIAGLADMLANCEDNIVDGRLKKAKNQLTEATPLFEQFEVRVRDLDHELDGLLEEESHQRVLIIEYKDEFRMIKSRYVQRGNSLTYAHEALDQQVKEIENGFSSFEEWMFATEFDKAKVQSSAIRESMDSLKTKIDELPDLIVKAKGVIPQLIGNVSELYGVARDKSVYLDHLEVPRNLEVVSETLKDDLTHLKLAEYDHIKEHLKESEVRLEQLKEQINREVKAKDEVDVVSAAAFSLLDTLTGQVAQLKKDIPVIIARFNFPDFEVRVNACESRVNDLMILRSKLIRMQNEERIPSSTLLISLRECQQDVELCGKDINTLLTLIDEANADETRARKQVLKLYLILNDIQIRMKKQHLPQISEQYHDDLLRSYQYVAAIQRLLTEEVLNVAILNGTVNEAIDYIYRLHNNVNNLIGVATMAESAIVYANKYRSTFLDINADLNRAEFAFRNGEYTQSLSTIVNAIDRHQPGISHEEFIKENSQSA